MTRDYKFIRITNTELKTLMLPVKYIICLSLFHKFKVSNNLLENYLSNIDTLF